MAKEQSKLSRKIDQVCRTLFLTEEGKPKSASMLYSFCLGLLFIAVYITAYMLLIDVFEKAFAECSVTFRNLAETILPGLIGSIPCVALMFLLKTKKSLVPAAYVWIAILTVGIFIAMIFIAEDKVDYQLFWAIVGAPLLVCVISGGLVSFFLYRKMKAKEDGDLQRTAGKRRSYYNT